MGVYIDIKMPTTGMCKTITIFDDGVVVEGNGSKKLGIAIAVPPHGRLGDLNSLAERLEDLRKTTMKENSLTDNYGFNNGIICGIGAAINEVRYYTPTIISATNKE